MTFFMSMEGVLFFAKVEIQTQCRKNQAKQHWCPCALEDEIPWIVL